MPASASQPTLHLPVHRPSLLAFRSLIGALLCLPSHLLPRLHTVYIGSHMTSWSSEDDWTMVEQWEAEHSLLTVLSS
jgi:hypothetical protein